MYFACIQRSNTERHVYHIVTVSRQFWNIFIHGFLLQRTGAVFEASVQRTDGCDNCLDMSVYLVQDI